jgi:hypothetical protein
MKSKIHLNSVISTKGRNLINKGLDSSFVRHESFARTGEAMTNKKTPSFPEGLRGIFRPEASGETD